MNLCPCSNYAPQYCSLGDESSFHGPAYRSLRPEQVRQFAIEYFHQTFNDLLVPMGGFAVDETAKLCDRDGYPNTLKPADQLRDRPYLAFGHDDPSPPDDLSPGLCVRFLHGVILSELCFRHNNFAFYAKYFHKSVDITMPPLANCTALNERRDGAVGSAPGSCPGGRRFDPFSRNH